MEKAIEEFLVIYSLTISLVSLGIFFIVLVLNHWFKFVPFFRWYDLWVGFYIDRKEKYVYFCFFPTIGLKIRLKEFHERLGSAPW